MPAVLNVPGVYIEEIQPDVHPIAGVSTSDTAFLDYFVWGPLNTPVRVSSFAEFSRVFGGLDANSDASYAIAQYFANGGNVAWVVRVDDGSGHAAALTLQGKDANDADKPALVATSKSVGVRGNSITVTIDYETDPKANPAQLFNLILSEVRPGTTQVLRAETLRNLSMDASDPRYAVTLINASSELVIVSNPQIDQQHPANTTKFLPSAIAAMSLGGDGSNNQIATKGEDAKPATTADAIETGINSLDQIAPANVSLMCLPGAPRLGDAVFKDLMGRATTFCEARRIFLLIDIPESVTTAAGMTTWRGGAAMPTTDPSSAIYFPRLNVPDPLAANQIRSIPSSGTIAGITARTDAARGVWKAPAGTDASIRGATLVTELNDSENGLLNVQGVNILRSFPIYGSVVWGARTTDGADAKASPWKYIPVRRMALYLEESLYQGLKWVTFEPNDFPLWSQIRLNVGAFLNGLFRQGAFAGVTPRDAYFVKCDKDTTTQADVDRGVVNILVGFAPLKPAEFVVLQIQQMAGQGAG